MSLSGLSTTEGGVGVGKAVNGGFGLVLDGSAKVDEVIRMAIPWDAMGGVARRAWARNPNAVGTCEEYNDGHPELGRITLPNRVEPGLIERVIEASGQGPIGVNA